MTVKINMLEIEFSAIIKLTPLTFKRIRYVSAKLKIDILGHIQNKKTEQVGSPISGQVATLFCIGMVKIICLF